MGETMEPRYEGEDTRATSKKELNGFYAYSWASEVFVICGMGSFIPITLEQLARDRGVLLSDRKTPCSPPNGASASSPPSKDAPQCILPLFGGRIVVNTASFAMYTFSISVFVQSLIIITMSGAADHGRFRKTLLLAFAFVGSAATMAFIGATKDWFMVAAALAIVANTCYGASSVLLNSFLPVMVRNHPEVWNERSTAAAEDEDGAETGSETLAGEDIDSDVNTALLPVSSNNMIPASTTAMHLATRISANGIGIGYISALLLQGLSILLITSLHLPLTQILFLIGLWWFIFTFPAAFFLRPRPGPPLNLPFASGRLRTLVAYTVHAWRGLYLTLRRARTLKDVLLFLAAWFLLSDAIATVSGTAVLFAKTTLNMSPGALGLIALVTTLSGILGAFSWPRLAAHFGWSTPHTILACICFFELIPLYGLTGYLPFVRGWGLGLTQPWEMYPLSLVYGFVLGGLSSLCRALFASLIPPGSETAFYALYAITDKGSSVFGPAIVGAITDRTGSIRPAFAFLAVLIVAPVGILVFVDVARGKREGEKVAREWEGRTRGGPILMLDEDGMEDYGDEEEQHGGNRVGD